MRTPTLWLLFPVLFLFSCNVTTFVIDRDGGSGSDADVMDPDGGDGGDGGNDSGPPCILPGTEEVCNGLDDDCNGFIDDGNPGAEDALCGEGTTATECDEGECGCG
ncbi:hypothetical protein KKF84_05255, partial [Myxococcota bacterium]|nr:hypothetical protein [Myxococcota bacterium]